LIIIEQYQEERDFARIISSCEQEGWVKFYTTRKAQFHASLSLSLTYVAYCEGQYCGFARFITDNCFTVYCCEIIIDQPYRRRGIASQLIENVKSLYPSCCIDVISDNDDFYRSNGFFIVGNGLRRP